MYGLCYLQYYKQYIDVKFKITNKILVVVRGQWPIVELKLCNFNTGRFSTKYYETDSLI